MKKDAHNCIGSSFGDYLKEDGIYEGCEAVAIKRIIVWQLQIYMEQCHATKTDIAKKMGTSRSLVYKILDEKNTSISLATILKVAKIVGKPVRFEFEGTETNCPT